MHYNFIEQFECTFKMNGQFFHFKFHTYRVKIEIFLQTAILIKQPLHPSIINNLIRLDGMAPADINYYFIAIYSGFSDFHTFEWQGSWM